MSYVFNNINNYVQMYVNNYLSDVIPVLPWSYNYNAMENG
jgi:hypothetical protein